MPYNNSLGKRLRFYIVLDTIILSLVFALGLVALTSVPDIIRGDGSERVKGIISLALAVFQNKTLVACEGTFVRCDERTHSHNGTTRYDYYAVVTMPDNKNISVECDLHEIENVREGDAITVVRPRNSAREQHFMVLAQKKQGELIWVLTSFIHRNITKKIRMATIRQM